MKTNNKKVSLSNNTILITGGTSGIGLELAKYFLKKNNRIIVTGRNEQRLEEAKTIGLIPFKCDFNQSDDLENLVVFLENNYPKLNGLINNAGVQHNYQFDEINNGSSLIREEININTVVPILLTQLLLPLITVNKNSFIVNVGSGLAFMPKTDGLVYSASKAALSNFTKGLQILLKDSPIKVFELIPPVTDTNMTARRDEQKMSPKKLVEVLMPQFEKGLYRLTVKKINLFVILSKFFPAIAAKIINSKNQPAAS